MDWSLEERDSLRLRAGVPLACGDLCQLGGESLEGSLELAVAATYSIQHVEAVLVQQVAGLGGTSGSSLRRITFSAETVSAAGGSSPSSWAGWVAR